MGVIPLLHDMLLFWSTDQDKQGRLDVTSILVGLIVAGIVIVIVGLLIWYFCHAKWKDNLSRSTWVRGSLLLLTNYTAAWENASYSQVRCKPHMCLYIYDSIYRLGPINQQM